SPVINLTYTKNASQLQQQIVDQYNGLSTGGPGLCGEIWYTVELNNAGDTQLQNLTITIPLGTGPEVGYTGRYEFTDVYTGAVVPGFDNDVNEPAIPSTGGDLVINLPPTIALNTLEKVRVRIYFEIE